ncbi:MAG: LytTR family transcriptional regulator DNA-binding domain-containing protein [Bacteroidota bacterium]
MKAIIIDDEQPARDLIKNYIARRDDIELVAEAEDGFKGVKLVMEFAPDVIFLDIQMPKLNGFEMLELLPRQAIVIFTTAFDEFAIKAFEKQAVDYLLKPFSYDRFNMAIERAKERLHLHQNENHTAELTGTYLQQSAQHLERVIIKKGDKIIIVPVEHISYIEAEDDYVMVYAQEGRFLKEKTMRTFEEQLNPTQFVRIHRSFIVNIQQIESIQLYEKESYLCILKTGEKIKASKAGYKRLRELF